MNSGNRLVLTLVFITILAISMVACSSPAPSAKPAPAPPAPTSSAPAPPPPTTTTAAAPASPKPSTTTAAPAPATTTAAPTASPKAVSAAADFYSKNVLTIYTSGAGGSSDLLSRLIATYWSQKVEGGLARVINNAGGNARSSLVALQNAKPDGLSMGLAGEIEGSVLLGDPSAKYDPTAFIYIGAVGRTPSALYLSAKGAYKSADDIKGVSGFSFGTSGLITSDSIVSAFLASALGLKDARLVAGYTGSAEVGLALGRGELGGAVMGAATGKEHVDNGLAKPAVILIDYVKSPWFPDTLPLASQLAKFTPEQEALLSLAVALQNINKFPTTPGVPQDRIDFMRDVIMNKIVTDKNFLAQTALRWPVWDKPVTGVEIAARVKQNMAIDKKIIDNVKVVINKMAGL